MTLKFKISLFVSLLFTILFGIAAAVIIISFSNFRKEEFKMRLENRVLTSIRLLIDVREVDNQLLRIIDKNSSNRLYNEKITILDSKYHSIYNTADSLNRNTNIKWTIEDLALLKTNKTFFKKEGENEIYGVFYQSKNRNFYALISANDTYGKRKLQFLVYVLLFTYIFFTATAWLLSFYVIRIQLKPLDYFLQNISKINESNLASRLTIEENSENEINLIGKEFNFMMNRIEEAYQKQKEFTAQASHELRTPLARISVLLENQIQVQTTSGQTSHFLQKIFSDVNQLKDLISSLLVLSKIDNKKNLHLEKVRIDEVIYSSIEHSHKQFPDLSLYFSIDDSENISELLEIACNYQLLEIAFNNLLKNAYLYSDNNQAVVAIKQQDGKLRVVISNTGATLSQEEQARMFQPFMRGNNAQTQSGLGLGLRIVQRILNAYNFQIYYTSQPNLNEFILVF